MGTGFSFFLGETSTGLLGSSSLPAKPGLGDLPESCISSIFMYLDPPEICKLAQMNRAFRAASLADFVWESKLPSNFKFLVDKVLDHENLPKKEIYARLCQPNCFDGGTKVPPKAILLLFLNLLMYVIINIAGFVFLTGSLAGQELWASFLVHFVQGIANNRNR